jgi:hypothetical protein
MWRGNEISNFLTHHKNIAVIECVAYLEFGPMMTLRKAKTRSLYVSVYAVKRCVNSNIILLNSWLLVGKRNTLV